MVADVAGSDFLKGIEYVVWAGYSVLAITAAAFVWAVVSVFRSFFHSGRVVAGKPSLDSFRSCIHLACQSHNVDRILEGRHQVTSWSRDWVVARMEQAAVEWLDLADPWQYRRLLELAALLDSQLVQRIVALGLDSADLQVRTAALS